LLLLRGGEGRWEGTGGREKRKGDRKEGGEREGAPPLFAGAPPVGCGWRDAAGPTRKGGGG